MKKHFYYAAACIISASIGGIIYGYFSPIGIQPRIFSIMLDPAGDAQNPGRVIDDSSERAITLQFADELKEILEHAYPDIRIVLTRFPGETVQPLQNANFANRLNVDFYLSIHFYQETDPKPKLYLYQFSYGNEPISKKNDLAFSNYDTAHLAAKDITHKYGNLMLSALEDEPNKKLFDVVGVHAIPLKPLIGITSPALAFEAGLKNKDDWQGYIAPIAASIKMIIEHKLAQDQNNNL